MRIFIYLRFWLIVIIIPVFLPLSTLAQPAPIPFHIEPYTNPPLGPFDGPIFIDNFEDTSTSGVMPFLVSSEIIQFPGAVWLQLNFENYNLGEQSYIVVTSLADGSNQRLDAISLQQWQNSTAYFNGDTVEIELFLVLGDTGIFYQIGDVVVGDPIVQLKSKAITKEICGSTDDRVASNDAAVGRIFPVGCTGWMVSNGAGLTAGHCVGTGHTLQFNVPASTANGTIVQPPAADQYPITYLGNTNGGNGNDWAVFRLGANTNGVSAINRQNAFYRMSRDLNPTTVRETGFGIDGPPPLFGDAPPATPTNPFPVPQRNAQSQTQQTHAGNFVSETVGTPPRVTLRFRIDDENGNSGSPVIDTSNNITIGIATAAGCTATGGSNVGTSFENDNLENALENFPGNDAVYVDRGHIMASSIGNGTIFRPFDTVVEAVNAVPANGIISMVVGSYNEQMTISKAMTLMAPVGIVTIGRP